MTLPAATYISQLDPDLPDGDLDTKAEGDDWIRLLQAVLQAQFPNLGAAAVTPTAAQLNTITAKAAKAGDTYTGTHDFTGATLSGSAVTATTATAGTSTTAVATTAFVAAAMAALSATSVDLTTSVETSDAVTGVNGKRHVLTNVAATAVTTPGSPTIGMRFGVVVGNSLTTNSITYGSAKIMGLAEDLTLDTPAGFVELVYINATLGWWLA